MRAQRLLQGFVASALLFHPGAAKKSCKPRPSSQLSQTSTPILSTSDGSTPTPSTSDASSSSIIVSFSDTPVSTPILSTSDVSTPTPSTSDASSSSIIVSSSDTPVSTPTSVSLSSSTPSEVVSPSATPSSIDTSALSSTTTPSTSTQIDSSFVSISTSTPGSASTPVSESTPASTIESTSAIESTSTIASTSAIASLSTSSSTSNPPPSTTSTLGPIVTQFALQGRDRDPPSSYNGNSIVDGKPAQVKSGSILYFNPPSSQASQYSPGQFYLDTLNYIRVFGTNQYLVSNTQGNGVYSVASIVAGYYPLQCSSPIRQGQPLQCMAVGKGTNIFAVSNTTPTGQLQLVSSVSATVPAIDLIAA